ncbi:hypothetical protein GCM10025771_12800 [Niveibacterium umoris]|uniref:Protein TonB n=1 Tax=Niveibacterium umoris TaxID=1193620 RepID=A0A840BIW4_9RHOO|nr:TonB family protein [Niveibacterium umoris]MBB4013165.1 protein TonB [Niveibacterium umoris]
MPHAKTPRKPAAAPAPKPAAGAAPKRSAPANPAPAASPAPAAALLQAPKAPAEHAAPRPSAKRRRLRLPPATRRIGSENIFWGAISVSIVLHAVLLVLRFAPPDWALSRQRDKGLDIVLVNAKHARAPKDAQALAQANMDGGGNSKDKARPTTPLPPQELNVEGDELMEAKRRIERLEERQRDLLKQSKSLRTAEIVQGKPQPNPEPSKASGADQIDRTRAIARLEGEISKDIQEYAAKPKKAYATARTTEYAFAQYVEDWRQKLERVGTLNFPHDKNGRLYGNLLIEVTIRADGSIGDTRITRSSGNPALDNAALRILQLSSPFAPFNAEQRKKWDELHIIRTWVFSRDAGTLEARNN